METFCPLLAICAGNSPVTREFPAQRPVTRSFDAFFDLRPNKRLSKQSWGWWFETPSRPLWRHGNVYQHFTTRNLGKTAEFTEAWWCVYASINQVSISSGKSRTTTWTNAVSFSIGHWENPNGIWIKIVYIKTEWFWFKYMNLKMSPARS